MPTEQNGALQASAVPARFRLRRYIFEVAALKLWQAAGRLEVTPGHLSNVIAGRDPVSLALAARIERWTNGEIPAVDWVPPPRSRSSLVGAGVDEKELG
ncbi:MAG TPA: hypothetical protein VNJ70_17945 [Thermoanaerobaculia bacterium]|nr:hypothetical protein [Thermoanaerobaculia bacterium]